MTAEVIGLPIIGLPEKFTPLCALVVIKFLNEDGHTEYRACATDNLMAVEAMGMAHYALNRLSLSEEAEPE